MEFLLNLSFLLIIYCVHNCGNLYFYHYCPCRSSACPFHVLYLVSVCTLQIHTKYRSINGSQIVPNGCWPGGEARTLVQLVPQQGFTEPMALHDGKSCHAFAPFYSGSLKSTKCEEKSKSCGHSVPNFLVLKFAVSFFRHMSSPSCFTIFLCRLAMDKLCICT